MRIIDDEAEEIDDGPSIIYETEDEEPLTQAEVNLNQKETDESYEEELSNDLDLNSITNENEFQEAVADGDDEFDLDDLLEPDSPSPQEPTIEETPSFQEETTTEFEAPQEEVEDDITSINIGDTGMAFSEDLSQEFVQDEPSYQEPSYQEPSFEEPSFEDSGLQEESFTSQPNYEIEDAVQSDFVEFIDDEEDTSSDLKPFRTFTKINLAEELAEENEESEEEEGILAGMNRNVLIILAIIILSLGYFLFNTFFNREIETRSRKRRRPPKKEKILGRKEQVLTPVWEISDQENAKSKIGLSEVAQAASFS